MVIGFDVIIERDFAFLAFCVEIRLDRQRLECWALNVIEQCTPARSQVPRHAGVELRHQLTDGSVDLEQREELPIAQLGGDPARRYLHRDFHLGFGEGRRLQAMRVRPAKRYGSRIPSIRFAVASSS